MRARARAGGDRGHRDGEHTLLAKVLLLVGVLAHDALDASCGQGVAEPVAVSTALAFVLLQLRVAVLRCRMLFPRHFLSRHFDPFPQIEGFLED